jgi:glycolate oxidase FAD binding subunit
MAPPVMMSRILEDLSAITGAQHISVSDEGITAEPIDTNAVAEIIRYANQERLSVGVRGGGTKQQWARGETPQICVSLNRLNRLVEHPWQDLTCTVQAGCRWEALQSALAGHGQFVALDPLFPERATVGGILSTNDFGPLRQQYGSLRDLVIGMTLVLADGTIAKSGGKVVKNVAGYDLCKLMTGSYGTLAIITDATFRLHPVPQHARSFTIAAENATCLAPLVAAIRSSHLLTQSLQVRRTPAECYLDICINAHPLARQGDVLLRLAHENRLEMGDASEKVWSARQSIFLDETTVLRIATLPDKVCQYIDDLQAMSATVVVESISQTIGLHDVALRGSRDEVVALVQKLRAMAASSDVTVSVIQRGVVEGIAACEIAAPVLSLMQNVKRQFDPNNMLNPGRLFSGA